ncbi:MAG: TIGR02147 family protein, partial [Bdellovibrionales bacterium]|nr:TIGR02147 family protein [Bdellovibrionales bacterium]
MKSSSRHRVDQELLTLMLNEIFQYKHYKRYLRDRLTHETKFTKGLKIKLARHIGCQPSYLSQVLNGDPNFTLEQATLLNDFFNHGKTEAKYFLLLLQHERAGTKRLKDFFIEEIEALREERFNLKKRLPDTEELPASTRHNYYSSWYYSAIHIMLSIPEFQSVTAISQRLRLPPSLVKGVVE